jgi:23S rRNA (pseudouridine1915-N3)-methyltransferase
MLKVRVLTVGKCKEVWLEAALKEYEQRMKSSLSVTWLLAKDEEQLIEWASKEPQLIALDLHGQLVASEALSRKLRTYGARMVFLIGGAEGIPPALLPRCVWRWSLSPLTFTHQMTRLILLEQLYRCLEIERGSQYHK